MEKSVREMSSAMRKTKCKTGLMAVLAMTSVMMSCSEKIKCVFQPGDGKTVPVTMRIASLEQIPFSQVTGGTKANASPAGICNKVNFAVYTENDGAFTRVNQINQDAGSQDFGVVTLNLAEGSYKLLALAHGGDGNPTMTNPLKVSFNNRNTLKMTDTFMYCSDITVTDDTHELNLQLKRVVGMFQLHLKDTKLHEDIRKLRFEYTGGSSTINAVTGLGCVASRQSETLDIDPEIREYGVYTFRKDDSDKLKVTVSALDSAGVVLKSQEFIDVPIANNYITRYSGEMFSKVDPTPRFSMFLDNDWAGTDSYDF